MAMAATSREASSQAPFIRLAQFPPVGSRPRLMSRPRGVPVIRRGQQRFLLPSIFGIQPLFASAGERKARVEQSEAEELLLLLRETMPENLLFKVLATASRSEAGMCTRVDRVVERGGQSAHRTVASRLSTGDLSAYMAAEGFDGLASPSGRLSGSIGASVCAGSTSFCPCCPLMDG